MGRDSLELARGSLFIEKIKSAFKAADVDLLSRVYDFSEVKSADSGKESFQAAELLLEQKADAITISGALLAPFVWYGRVELSEILSHFGHSLASTLKDLSSPFILRIDTENHRRKNIQTLLASLEGHPRKAVIRITFRLIELEGAHAPYDAAVRQLARETPDLYVPIANRLSLGELRRRLEDACFRILDEAGYERLRQKIAPIQADDDKYLEILLAGVQGLLNNNGIQGSIQVRTKSLYGIHRKMKRTCKTTKN